jgi:Big-like domain-containing protein/putative glycosyl hydrolase-like family 15 (GHL15) protein
VRTVLRNAACSALLGLLVASGLVGSTRPAAAAAPPFGTYVQVAAANIPDTASRQALARRYGLVVVRGQFAADLLSDLRQARPGIKIFAYEQSAGLSSSEADTVQQSNPEWLARDCSGDLIHPNNISNITLADLTNSAFRAWRADQVAAEVAVGTDGAFLDTLGAYFPPDFYTGRPCTNRVPVSDAAWRDGSAAMITAVRQRTARSVIANAFGLGTGTAYYQHAADSDVLINAADAVQIEGFTRWGNTPADNYYPDARWKDDIAFLSLLGNRGKMALAYTKVGVETTTAKYTALRDYALGTFLEGFVPGNAWFGFTDKQDVPAIDSDAAWTAPLGAPTGPATVGTNVVRNFAGGTLTMTVGAQPAPRYVFTVAITSSANPAVAGQPVTFTATVGSPTGPPTGGSVQFFDNGASLGSPQPLSGGQASATAALSGGTHTITASYVFDPSYPGASGSMTETVFAGATVGIASSVNPSVYGKSVTFTATVKGASGAPAPTGSVQFQDNGVDLGVPQALNSYGKAKLTTAALGAGTHTITALYQPTPPYQPASASRVQTVNKATPSVALSSSRPTSPQGQPVTFTAIVKGPSGTPPPTGSVQFQDKGVALGGPQPLDASGRATLTVSTLTVGSHKITAAYSGDANLLPRSVSISQTIN